MRKSDWPISKQSKRMPNTQMKFHSFFIARLLVEFPRQVETCRADGGVVAQAQSGGVVKIF